MAAKLIVLAAVIAAALAGPVWIEGDNMEPGIVMRIGRSPSMAFGFGSGFSSNIGGISHSTGISSAFQSGGARAYGSGYAAAGDNGAYARGAGIAASAPAPYPYQQAIASAYNSPLSRNNFGSASSSAQNFGDYGTAASMAQAHNGRFGSATSAAQNNGFGRYQTAVASAQNQGGLGAAQTDSGYGLVYEHSGDYGTAVSSAQTHDGHDNFEAAVSAAESAGAYKGSSAQTLQRRGGSVRNSGASSINGPGLQAAHSHAVNTGLYY